MTTAPAAAKKQHAESMAAALAQLEHIKAAIRRSADHMQASPTNWGIAGDMAAILRRLNEVVA